MLKSFKYRIYPNKAQEVLLNKHIEAAKDWICKNCDREHDRDVNAAINIKNFDLKNYVSGTDIYASQMH